MAEGYSALCERKREKYIDRGDDTWAREVTDTDGKDESHVQSSRLVQAEKMKEKESL